MARRKMTDTEKAARNFDRKIAAFAAALESFAAGETDHDDLIRAKRLAEKAEDRAWTYSVPELSEQQDRFSELVRGIEAAELAHRDARQAYWQRKIAECREEERKARAPHAWIYER